MAPYARVPFGRWNFSARLSHTLSLPLSFYLARSRIYAKPTVTVIDRRSRTRYGSLPFVSLRPRVNFQMSGERAFLYGVTDNSTRWMPGNDDDDYFIVGSGSRDVGASVDGTTRGGRLVAI